MSNKKFYAFVLLAVFVSGLGLSYWIIIPEQELDQRIQPLTDAGFTRERAIYFDETHQNWAPYNESAVKYAQFWNTYQQFSELLLNCTKSLGSSLFLLEELNSTNSDFTAWLSEDNPFLFGYLRDGNLEHYENEVLLEAATLGELAPYLMRMPEVYTKEANITDVLNYIAAIQLMKAEDPDAARFVLETGLFMEDKLFSELEQRFINESLVNTDLLRLYVSGWILDGIQHVPFRTISIDGDSEDWIGIDPLVVDEENNTEVATDPGSNIKAFYAVRDKEALYLMVEYYGKANSSNLVDLYFNKKPGPSPNFRFGKDGFVSWSKEWEDAGIKVCYDVVAESSIPLKLLNDMFCNSSMIFFQPMVYLPLTHSWGDSVSWQVVRIGEDRDLDTLKSFNSMCSWNLSYIADDLYNLPEIKDGISSRENRAIQWLASLVNASKTDYQIRKGICLLDEYGVPDQSVFSFEVPSYNTQLEVLLWLIQDRDIPTEYYRVALAFGLDYGSVVTVGNGMVDNAVRNYVSQMFDLIANTDLLIGRYDAEWRAKDYPLEACMGLVWSGGLSYPMVSPEYFTLQASWEYIFTEKQMNKTDFFWLFPEIDTLKSIQKWAIENFVLTNSSDTKTVLNGYLYSFGEHPYSELCYSSKTDHLVAKMDWYFFYGKYRKFICKILTKPLNISGYIIYPDYRHSPTIHNLEWLWSNFQEQGVVEYGACMTNSYLTSTIAKALNIACIIGEVHHAAPTYYENEVWQAAIYDALYPIKGEKPPNCVFNWGWVKIPWDNFYIPDSIPSQCGWYTICTKSPFVWGKGFPIGYIFRADRDLEWSKIFGERIFPKRNS